jgi:hypothetical protein
LNEEKTNAKRDEHLDSASPRKIRKLHEEIEHLREAEEER